MYYLRLESGRHRDKGCVRSGDLLEIRICLRVTQKGGYVKKGRGWGGLGYTFSSSVCVRMKTAKNPFSFLPPYFPSLQGAG